MLFIMSEIIYLQKVLCKDQKAVIPQSNVSLPGGLPSTSGEPRVPPLPSEHIAAAAAPDHMITSSPGSAPLSGKRRKSHNGGKPSGIHHLPSNEQEQPCHKRLTEQKDVSVHPPLHIGMLHSLEDPRKLERMVVMESIQAGMGEDLAMELKECEIDLERIDQELLELGPFAKDMYHDLNPLHKNEPNTPPLSGMVAPARVLMSPPELIGVQQYQQQRQSPLRRSRKVSQQMSNSKVGGKDTKRRSEDGYVSSPMSASSVSLGEERGEPHPMPERLAREKEGGMKEQQQHQKGKWRKVGSAGSPVIPPRSSKTVSNSHPQHASLGSSNSCSPVSDSSHMVPPTNTTASKVQKAKPRGSAGGGGKGLDTDVDSPSSMIPAASEIEMLSLYMPNSPWETIGSSPLHSDHDSTTDVQAVIGSGSPAEKVVDYNQDKVPSDGMDSRSEPNAHGPSHTTSRHEKVSSSGEDYQKLHSTAPVFVTSTNTHGNSNWPSPLATSVARHSPGQLVDPRSECRGSLPAGNELRRHVVVRDGTPVCMPSSSSSLKSGFSVTQLTSVPDPLKHQHYQNMSVSHGVREHRSATPVERISPPGSNPVGAHHPHHVSGIDVSSVKHRRSSSSSSVRSIKQHQLTFDEGLSSSAQPSPLPTHTRVSVPRQTSSPLTQQALQQMQLLGGGAMGEVKSLNNTLGGGESTKLAMMNSAGGISWLPCSTATAAASQLAGQPNFLGPQTSIAAAASAMNAAGLSCYPFPNPFLPGGSWLPTAGGMLATAGLPHQLQPSMFSLDPNSAYKQVFNPALMPYRYPLVTQTLKNFPSSSPQVLQSPSALGGSNLSLTPAGSASPHNVVYPVAPNTNRSAFHSVGTEPGGVGVGGSRTSSQANSATPPLLCLPPTQPQGFPGMLSPAQVLTAGGKDDNNGSNNNSKAAETSAPPPPGVNWMQNPAALMGSAAGFSMMPYLMSQAQLGIAGSPGSQQALSMFNASQLTGGAPQPPLHSDGSLAQVGAGGLASVITSSQDHALLPPHKPQPQRRGSSASVELVRGEVSPSNTPPLGMGVGGGVGMAAGGAKKPQYPIMMNQDVGGVWKPAGDQTANPPIVIHPYEYQNPDTAPSTATSFSSTSAMHSMITPSGHMMQAGFPNMPVTHPHSHLVPKGRGEMLIGGGGRGSPRSVHNDKPKLQMHHVRHDDFQLPVKPDRRRKRWRGKSKDSFLSTRAELAEASLQRMGKVGESLITPLSPFPASMAVEPGSDKVSMHCAVSEKHVAQREASKSSAPLPTAVAGSKDGNYALNMLADMSSIQSSKEKQEGNVRSEIQLGGNTGGGNGDNGVSQIIPTSLSSSVSTFRHRLRSPVSLAARSLLMLGEDLSQAHDDKPRSHAVTHVENTAATSLLQLSGAMISGNEASRTKPSDASQNQREWETDEMVKDTEGHSTCSASISAAEAMILMGAGKKPSRDTTSTASSYTEVFETSQHDQCPNSTDNAKGDSTIEKQERSKPGSVSSKRPRNLTFDSEVTDTDSEATLTPSPNARKDHAPFLNLYPINNEDNQVACQEHHSYPPLDGVTKQLDLEAVECNLQKHGDGPLDSSEHAQMEHSGSNMVPDSETAVSRYRVSGRPDFTSSTTCVNPKMITSGPSREDDMTTKDCQSVTGGTRVHTGERNHSDCSNVDVNTSHSTIPSSTCLTAAGALPSVFPSSKLLDDSKQERDEGGENKPLAKRPKFISTFGPVSENETYPTLPLKIDGRTGNDKDDVDEGVSDGPVLSQVNLSPSVATKKTREVASHLCTEGEMDVLRTGPKESSNLSEGKPEDMEGRSETSVSINHEILENERDVLIDVRGDESRESESSMSVVLSHQNNLEHETCHDDDDSCGGGGDAEIYRNANTLDLENRQELASPASKAESTMAATGPRKKKEIASSGPEKEKTKHRSITIKRNSSKGLSTTATTSLAPPTVPNPSRSDSKSRTLPSWTAFADAVDQDSTDSHDEGRRRERTGGEHVARVQASEKQSGSEDEFDSKSSHLSSTEDQLSAELNVETAKVEGSISSPSCYSAKVYSDSTSDSASDVLQMDPTTTALAPQNRLVVNRSAKQQHRKHGAQLPKQGGSKKDKGSKFNKRQQEHKAKDLFDVELPQIPERVSKREKIEKRGSEKEEKISKFSQQLSNKSSLPHSQQMMLPCSEDLEHHQQRYHVDCYSGSQEKEGTSSHVVCDSDTILSTTKSRILNQTSPSHQNQFSGTSNRMLEREFSPLSDDDDEMTMPTSSPAPRRVPMPKDSSKWSEVDEGEPKRMRRQGDFTDSPAALLSPSPSSSTSSSSAKKHYSHHHHRHHDRYPGGGGGRKHDRKREKSASTSRGSSPTDHKKHHRHHHHSSHHHRGHLRDDGRSLDNSSKRPSHEVTPKDEIFVGAASHPGNEDWHDGSLAGSMTGGGRCRKRRHISSDEDDKPLVEFSGGGDSLSVPSSRRKVKHRDHKERWKESNKHKHGGHKH